MGRDKRRLRLAGVTLLARNIAFLQGVFPVVGVSVRDPSQAPPDLPHDVEVIPDVVPGSPLAGLASVLARFREPVFALATDIAFPERDAVEKVLAAFADVDVALPVAGDHLEPLHALYGPGCLPHMERLLAAGARSILDLLPEVRVATVAFESVAPFFNVNTPEDWDQARRRSATTASRPVRHQPVALGIVGRPGSGKTTLIERLIPEFTGLGLRVAAVKSVARFEIDTPGKDSWRHGQAGATAYAIASASRLSFVTEQPEDADLGTIVERYFDGYDLVVCEGYREEAPHVVEVLRCGVGHAESVCPPGRTLALVTDSDIPHAHRFELDESSRLARFLLTELGLTERRE